MNVDYIKFDYPIGTNILNGKSSAIVLSRNFNIHNKFIAIIEDNKAICLCLFSDPVDFEKGSFNNYFHLHRLPISYKSKCYPNCSKFYLYKIEKMFPCLPKIKIENADSIIGKIDIKSNSSLVKL